MQDGDFRFEIGGLDIGDEAPLEAAAQAVFELGEFLGRTIAGDHDLLHGFVQSVEGVEKLFLGALFLGEELNVVDEQDIHGAEFVAEADHLVVAQRVDHFIGELLAGCVADGGLRRAALDFVTDGLHEMGFAHADAAVEEERIVGFRRTLGDGLAGGMGELVAAADDEGVEGIAGVELGGAIPIEAGLGWMQGREGCLRTRSCVLNGTRQAAVVANGRIRRIVVGGHELDVFVTEAEIVERLLNEVGVLVANVAELGGGNADEQNFIAGVAVASGFEPGVVGMAVDLFFESVEDARPRIRDDGGTGKRHCLPE